MARKPSEDDIRRALRRLEKEAEEAVVADVSGPDEQTKVLIGVELERFTLPDGSEEYLEATTRGRNRRLRVVDDVEDIDPEARTIGLDPEVLAERDDRAEERE